MILRRFADALRNQEWATVAIEFLIVVVGIFVGLQVNDWSQERQNRADERAALDRLFVEMQNAHADIINYNARNERLNGLRRSAIAFVDGTDPLPENDLPLKIGINTLAQFPAFTPVTAVFEELKSSGQLQLIQSSDLRVELAQYHTGLEWLNTMRQGFANGTDSFWVSYQRHVKWAYNPESTTTDILISSYDWQGLRGDEQFKFAAIGLLRNQLVADQGLRELQENVANTCAAIGREIDRECDLGAGNSAPQ
ncbi:MAG: hypothetical protein JJ850_11350 [Kordiimonadaceae bacterium]|nr:hypothetical protein [Kordiimonadaceae bacterium]MBO6568817.1 hypothetical protein [Kordiimonadaceae bacterium]MBO6965208.1 hypothetical protein [Kordiimonadaceae bacterium]